MTKTLCKYMEIALSIMLFGVCIYQSVVGGYLFLLVCFIYLAETVIYVLASRSQRLLKVASLVQFLQSPIAMTVLLDRRHRDLPLPQGGNHLLLSSGL